jgi:hypothetical protein
MTQATYPRTFERPATTPPATGAPNRRWAWTAVVAGVAGLVAIGASTTIDAVYDEKYQGDAAAITDRLGDLTGNLLVFHTATMIATVLLVVVAAGLRRRLAGQVRAGSLLPEVAAGGLLLTSVAGLMGAGLDTEFIFGLSDDKAKLVPEVAAMYGHWVGTIPWLWVGAGITGVAVAAAALKHAAAPRWIGFVSAVLGGLTLLAGLSPLQYMAGFTGPVLLVALGLGFALGDRAERV